MCNRNFVVLFCGTKVWQKICHSKYFYEKMIKKPYFSWFFFKNMLCNIEISCKTCCAIKVFLSFSRFFDNGPIIARGYCTFYDNYYCRCCSDWPQPLKQGRRELVGSSLLVYGREKSCFLFRLYLIQVSQVLQLAHFGGVKGVIRSYRFAREVNGRYYGRPKVCWLASTIVR